MQENQKGFPLSMRILLGFLGLAVVVYTVYHVSSLFRPDMTTIAAGSTTEYTAISSVGYVFRDETVLYSSNGGAVDYQVKDGGKVSTGQPLAYVYEGKDGARVRSQLRTLDERIAVLEQSTAAAVAHMDISVANQQTAESYAAIVKLLASGELGGLEQRIDEMLIGMNRADVIAQKELSVAENTLAGLYAQRETLLSGNAMLHTSGERNGYFYSVVDGYESVFTMAAANNLTPKRLDSLLASRQPTTVNGDLAYGKLAVNSQWNFVIPLSEEEASYFKTGERVEISFFRESGVTLPMTLEEIVTPDGEGERLLRFFCDRLPENFVLNRSEDVQIIVDSVSGMHVPKDAVYEVDGRMGVYILKGSVVQFRCIDVVHEGEGYYLVREEISDEREAAEGVTYLRPNDLIILNGKHLFDGRIMD